MERNHVLLIIGILGVLISGFVVINDSARAGTIYAVLVILALFILINWGKIRGEIG